MLFRKLGRVNGMPCPANTEVLERPSSKLGVNLKLIFCPLIKGCGFKNCPNCPINSLDGPDPVTANWWPESWPTKNSIRMSPSSRKIQGSRNGALRLTRKRFSGSALSLKRNGPPSFGPHHRLCLPKENCQFAKFIPT